MFRFIESIKLKDGEFCRSQFHQERINAVFHQFYPEIEIFNLKHILQELNIPKQGTYKCRLVFDSKLHEIQIVPYNIRPISSLKLVEVGIDSSFFKSEERSAINAAFENRKACDDVLMVVNSCITDTSYANVAFYDGETWFTPEKPLIFGTQRAALIQSGKISAKQIFVSDVSNYSRVRIFNAMIEFGEIEFDVRKIEL